VTYLCDEKAQHVSGQLFAVRGREVFIFNQPRPKARTINTETDWSVDTLAVAVDEELKSSFTALETDLEAFNTEPVI
ncbi:MAG: 3-hydroxyacyl-CoA dehydrogenase, partial [Alphaproteobacteria bacterium]